MVRRERGRRFVGGRECGRRAFLGGAVGAGGAASLPASPAVGVPGLDATPEVRWSLDAGTEAGDAEAAERTTVFPVARTRGTVVALVRRVGDTGATYTAHGIDAETGDRHWTRELDGDATIPRAAGGRAYLLDGGELVALDAADGSERWRVHRESIDYRDVAVGDRAVFVTRGARVTAVDAASGDERWTTEVRNNGRLGTPLLADGRVYLGGERGFYALDRETGRERWFSAVPDREATRVGGVRDGLVVGWSETAAYGLRVADGTRRWRRPHESLRPYGPGSTLDGDTAYLWGERLLAVNVRTGERRWSFDADGGRRYTPAVGDGSVYVPLSGGDFVALDADSGRERWRAEVEARSSYWGGPADGLVYVVGDGEARAFDAASGSERWTLDLGDESGLWADVSGESVFVATRGGTLYAVERPSALAVAPVAAAEEFATSPPGVGLVGLLAAGLLGAGYRLAGRRRSDPASGVAFGRLDRLRGGPATETYRKRVRTPDGPRLVAETRLTDDADPETRRAFGRAVERWADLDADGVLPVREYEVGPEVDSSRRFETPYLAGGSLADAWPVARRDRVEVVSGVARALHAAHREGVARGRLAPRHVHLDSPSEGRRDPRIAASDVSVGGWFLADALADVRDDDPYAPPEGRSDRSGVGTDDSGVRADDAGVRSDVYRVGALAYHLLAGAVPESDPEPASSRNPALSAELDAVLARALAADPGERYATALAFDDEFRWAAIDR